ncbi:MAG: serine hydrolase domain-containing protein [Thermomicrobiales bacterium]
MSTFPDASAVLSRRSVVGSVAGIAAAGVAARPGAFAHLATPAASPATDAVDAAKQIVESAQADYALRSIIATVRQGDDELLLTALGESMTGVPATTDMYFRNGAVAISLVSTLMLILAEQGAIGLDDPIATWLPDLPDADTATCRMLANMTAGYRDYVQSPAFTNAQLANPFHSFTREELLTYSFDQPRLFAPGTNWEYSHTSYQILGMVIEKATGETVDGLMQRLVLDPLGLKQTFAFQTATIPEPVLHAFTGERRGVFQIPADVPFYEESTFWNPAWTITRGVVQVQTIGDMASAMMHVGKGTLLSPESYAAMTGPSLQGFGSKIEGCNTCQTLGETIDYGLGVVRGKGWLIQNPLFSGYAGTAGYHPERDLTVAVQVTFAPESFDSDGTYIHGNASTTIFQRIAAALTNA